MMLSASSVAHRRLSCRFLSHAQRTFATTLIVGDNCASAVTAARTWTPDHDVHWLAGSKPLAVPVGISKVYYVDSRLPEVLAEGAVALKPECILASHDKQGSTVIPRIAGLKKAPCVTDVIAFEEDKNIIVRPMYAGNALVRVKISPETILSIRPTAFAAVKELADDPSSIPMESVETSYNKSEWISESTGASTSRPDLTSASTVVSGGRGLGEASQFTLVEQLADAIGDAAVGASRAAVDAGMYANDAQVGQTGKVVAPDLYIACGISGAIQHVSGMKDSKIIVAINKDPDAPIYQIADYGLVKDLFEVVPEMTKKILEQKNK